jgi:hypothetical protein
MTSRMEGDHPHRHVVIICDCAGCEQTHNSDEIMAGGGLVKMGWRTKFNEGTRVLNHFCPQHGEETIVE